MQPLDRVPRVAGQPLALIFVFNFVFLVIESGSIRIKISALRAISRIVWKFQVNLFYNVQFYNQTGIHYSLFYDFVREPVCHLMKFHSAFDSSLQYFISKALFFFIYGYFLVNH